MYENQNELRAPGRVVGSVQVGIPVGDVGLRITLANAGVNGPEWASEIGSGLVCRFANGGARAVFPRRALRLPREGSDFRTLV